MFTRATAKKFVPSEALSGTGEAFKALFVTRAPAPAEPHEHWFSALLQRLFTRIIGTEHRCAMPGRQEGARQEGCWTALDSLDAACSHADYVCPECSQGWRRPTL